MRLHNAFAAIAVIGIAALTASAADARIRHMTRADASYYSYGADKANPSLSPQGFDTSNPRDQQLQGHN